MKVHTLPKKILRQLKCGDWVVSFKIRDKSLYRKIQDGEITKIAIGGIAQNIKKKCKIDSLGMLDLHWRSRRVLASENIKTVKDLIWFIVKCDPPLEALKDCGVTTIKAIRNKLRETYHVTFCDKLFYIKTKKYPCNHY